MRTRNWLSTLSRHKVIDERGFRIKFTDLAFAFFDSGERLRASIVLVFILPVVLAAFNVVLWNIGVSATEKSQELVDFQLTSAEVLGGIAGIVFAVLVFSAELQSSKIGQDQSLLTFVFRRSGLLPSASIVLGSIIAILTNPALAAVGFHQLPTIGIIQTLFLIFLCTVVLIANIWNALRLSSVNVFDEVRAAIERDLHRIGRRADWEENLINEFISAIEKCGFEFMYGIDIYADDRTHIPLRSSKAGYIADVDVATINDVDHRLKEVGTFLKLTFCKLPFDHLSAAEPLAYLAIETELSQPDTEFENDQQGFAEFSEKASKISDLVGADVLKGIESILNSAFRIQRKEFRRPQRIKNVVEQLVVSTSIAIRNRTVGDVEARIALIERIIADWNSMERPATDLLAFGTTRPTLFPETTARTLGPITRAAATSNDPEIAEIIIRFQYRLQVLGARHNDQELFSSACDLQTLVYWKSMTNAVAGTGEVDHSQLVSQEIDNILAYLFLELSGENAKQTSLPLVSCFLASALTLIRDAILFGKPQDAKNFHQRLFYHEQHTQRGLRVQQPRCTADFIADAVHFSNIQLCSWCIRLVREREGNDARTTQAIQVLLEQARSVDSNSFELIRLWETYKSELHGDPTNPFAHLSALLELDQWKTTPEIDGRTLIVKGGFVDESWHIDGLLFLMLGSKFGAQLPGEELDPTIPGHFWDLPSINSRLDEIIELDLPIDKGPNISTQPESVRKALRRRVLLVRRRDFFHVAQSPISQIKIAELQEKILMGLEKKSEIHQTFESLGIVRNGLPRFTSLRYSQNYQLNKERFIEKSLHNVVFFERLFQDPIRFFRNTIPFISAERSLDELDVSDASAANISEILRRAMNGEYGRIPDVNLIVIPNTLDFEQGLFGDEHWNRRNAERLGKYHEGTWQDVNVVSFPYNNPRNVLLIDTRRLFVEHRLCQPFFDLEVISEDLPDFSELMNRAESACEPEHIPSDRDIKVSASLTVYPEIGVGDVSAGMRISIRDSNGSASG